jgi:hypothetical protein
MTGILYSAAIVVFFILLILGVSLQSHLFVTVGVAGLGITLVLGMFKNPNA